MRSLRQEDLWDRGLEDRHKRDIALQLYRLTLWLLAHAKTTILDADLIRWFHRHAFEGVFPLAAGLVRGYACPFDVNFGPHLGTRYPDCESSFLALSTEFVRYIGSLDQLGDGRDCEDVLSVACLHHAKFIQIHPFLDGNGRTSRLCVNYFAVRYGAGLVPNERDSSVDYVGAMDVYMRERRVDPLKDFWRHSMCAGA
jgi:fido (protein-threonine AMPylation protein)